MESFLGSHPKNIRLWATTITIFSDVDSSTYAALGNWVFEQPFYRPNVEHFHAAISPEAGNRVAEDTVDEGEHSPVVWRLEVAA